MVVVWRVGGFGVGGEVSELAEAEANQAGAGRDSRSGQHGLHATKRQ